LCKENNRKVFIHSLVFSP